MVEGLGTTCSQFTNNYFNEMCRGSDAGCYARLMYFCTQAIQGSYNFASLVSGRESNTAEEKKTCVGGAGIRVQGSGFTVHGHLYQDFLRLLDFGITHAQACKQLRGSRRVPSRRAHVKLPRSPHSIQTNLKTCAGGASLDAAPQRRSTAL